MLFYTYRYVKIFDLYLGSSFRYLKIFHVLRKAKFYYQNYCNTSIVRYLHCLNLNNIEDELENLVQSQIARVKSKIGRRMRGYKRGNKRTKIPPTRKFKMTVGGDCRPTVAFVSLHPNMYHRSYLN